MNPSILILTGFLLTAFELQALAAGAFQRVSVAPVVRDFIAATAGVTAPTAAAIARHEGIPHARYDKVVVSFSNQIVRTLPSGGFAGYSTLEPSSSWRYDDPRFKAMVQNTYTKILRFPGGNNSESFNWRTGDIPDLFLLRLRDLQEPPASKDYDRCDLGGSSDVASYEYFQPTLRVKGGVKLEDLAAKVLSPGSSVFVTLNSYSDWSKRSVDNRSPVSLNPVSLNPVSLIDTSSAHDLAASIKNKNIPVVLVELMSEPYLNARLCFWERIAKLIGMKPDSGEHLGHFSGRLSLAWLKLFNDAMKAANPGIKTALNLASNPYPNNDIHQPSWVPPSYYYFGYVAEFNQAISEYKNPYWDAVVLHDYSTRRVF